MSVRLNPVTLAKLEQFGRRRRRLVLTRGICSAIVSFLLLMSLIALADWRWVLSDALRWSLSSVGYVGVAVVVWLTCLRLLIRIPSKRELARRVEMAEPELRENLLSAVELSSDDPDQAHDSPVFRQLLQNQVGRKMAGLEPSSLLPLRLLRRWVFAALLAVIACGVLLSVADLPFRQLMARAILPGANIARVSRIHVTILEPTPHSLTVPQEETLAVVVAVSGGEVDEVTLEARTETNGVSRQRMRARSPSQFVANLSIGADATRYRILAGDAVTQRYTIRSRPRPSVRAFHKTYRFPEYAGLEDKTVTESHGDLIALEGTEAELLLDVDQDVAEAEIRWERSGSDETETIELEPVMKGQLRVTLPITEPGIYKVHLVARETGFENTFAPKHEIRPEPDLVPRVGFVDQQETTLLLPPNDILALTGLAEDDLPLVGLQQHVSVNGREWQETSLPIEEARRVTAAWHWDLLELNLKSGDQVTTKLVATDRNGTKGESIPLQIVVSAPDFDPDRHSVMELKTGLYDKLVDLADAIHGHQASAKGLIERSEEQDPDAGLREADRNILLDLAEKIRDEADRVFEHVVEILPQMPAGADAYELELAGRVVARIRHETMQAPAVYLDAVSQAEDAEQAEEDLKRVLKAFDESAEDAKRLEERYRDLVTHNILAAIALDLNALLEHQRQLLAPGTPQSWQRLLRQETVAINHIRLIERLIRDNMPRLGDSNRRRLLSHLDWARSRREQLEAATESEDQEKTLRRLADSLLGELPGRQNAEVLDGNLPRSIVDARKETDQRAGSIFVPLERLAHSAREVGRQAGQAAESDDSTESRRALRLARRAASELSRLHFPATTRLKSRRSVTQSRRDSDPQYAADAGLTRRALVALFDRYENEPPEDSEVPAILAQIAPAYRILEAGHEAVQLRASLNNLLSLERWESHEVTSRIDHPRQWDAVYSSLEMVARKLKEAKLPGEIASKVDGLRSSPPAQDAARKITQRRYRRDAFVAAAYELDELETGLDAVLEDVEPIMAEARALIAQYVPPIPQMARKTAEELRDLEQQTTEVADHVSDSSDARDEDAAPPIDEMHEQQQEVNERIEDLVDALVEDANAQDLLTEEGRERARDADDSVAIVQEPAARMNQAMQQAEAADQPAEQARQLARAAEQQEQTARALGQVAEHFERLESGEDVAETRNALRQAEREMGIAGQIDEQYRQARELGEMADKSLQQLLAELEAELPKNPAMQETLSEISRDVLQQAKNSLEYSSEQEESMRRAIERSDPKFQADKKALVREIQDIAQEASDLSRTLVAQANEAAAGAKAEQAHKLLEGAQRDLNEAAAKPKSVGDDHVLDDIVDAAREMADRLENASSDLSKSKDMTAKAKDESIHDTDQQRDARQRDLEAGRQRFQERRLRDAKNAVRSRDRSEKQALDRVKSAETSLRKTEGQVEQARQALEREPESESAQRNLDQANARRADAQVAVERAQRESQRAGQETEQAEQLVKQLEQAELPPLSAANPAAELADRYAEEATGIAEELARRAKELAGEPSWSEDLNPQESQLAQAATGQQNVGEDVLQAAEDVARAGRHEQRLDKPAISDRLKSAAEDVEEVAEDEVSRSEKKLADAAAEASSGDEAGTDENRQALAARASIDEAEEAISREAEALGEILDPPTEPEVAAEQAQAAAGEPEEAAGGTPPSAQPTPSEAAQGQFLARTLDGLDRALAAEQEGTEPQGAPQPGLPSLAQAAQAQAAMMAQARLQSRTSAPSRPSLEGALESADGAALTDFTMPDFSVTAVNRNEGEDWGKLRDQSAEDLTEGRRESVSAEYRTRVETYFRVIAERARKEK